MNTANIEKVESRSLPQAEVKNHRRIHLPRVLLNPILAAKLTLAALAGIGGVAGLDLAGMNVARADDTPAQCTASLTMLELSYFDRYAFDKTGEKEKIDKTDVALGPLPRQTVYLYNKDKKLIKTAVLEPEEMYSKVHFDITKEDNLPCDQKNANGKYWFSTYFALETNKEHLEFFAPSYQGNTWGYFGVPETDPTRLNELYDQGFGFQQVGTVAQSALGGSAPRLFATDQEIGNDIPDADREIMRKYLSQVKTRQSEEGIKQAQEQTRQEQRDEDRNWIIGFTIGGVLLGAFIRGGSARKTSYAYDDLKEDYDNLQSSHEALRGQFNYLQTGYDRLERQSQNRQSGLGIQAELDQAQADNRSLRNRNKNLEEEVRRQKEAIAKANTIRTKLDAAEQSNQTLKTSNESLWNENQKLKTSIDELTEELEFTQGKSPNGEQSYTWEAGRQGFRKMWGERKRQFVAVQAGDNGNEPEYVSERFRAGMSIVHAFAAPTGNGKDTLDFGIAVRAGLEYLIPKIWPDNRILKAFFNPSFNPEGEIAKIIFLPEQYRALSRFTPEQKAHVIRIHRVLSAALHPNNPNMPKGSLDPKLQDSIDILLKQINTAWPAIERMVR